MTMSAPEYLVKLIWPAGDCGWTWLSSLPARIVVTLTGTVYYGEKTGACGDMGEAIYRIVVGADASTTLAEYEQWRQQRDRYQALRNTSPAEWPHRPLIRPSIWRDGEGPGW